MAATLREQRLRADLAQGPEALAATRAALLVAGETHTQADVARQLTDLQRQISEWQAELTTLVGPEGTVAADTARLADLEQVQAALQDELRAAHDRLGRATADQLAREYHEAHRRVEAARAALGEEVWAAAFAAGRALSLEAAIAAALGDGAAAARAGRG